MRDPKNPLNKAEYLELRYPDKTIRVGDFCEAIKICWIDFKYVLKGGGISAYSRTILAN
jgi:hypothetical protein